MSTTVFRLPRVLPGVTPRQVSRSRLALAAKAAPEPEATSPLDSWERGFSRTAAETYYEEMGGVLPSRPEVDPDMPADVTQLTSPELGTLHARFVAYVQWLETELALIEITADEEEAFVDHVEAEVLLRKAGTVADKRAKTQHDLKFIQNQQIALIAKAKVKLMRARVKGYERCAAALSREMTRRTPPGE